MTSQFRWVERPPVSVPADFQNAIGGDPLVAQTLYQRGIRTVEGAAAFLDPDLYQDTSADALPDSQAAYTLMRTAIAQQHRILIWGDFDVDGQTATTLLVENLRQLGADVRFHIPVRGAESHGISPSVLQDYLDDGFDLLITCDTGITEHQNVAAVRQAGIPVIVTDHHALADTLPEANAVVNPQRLDKNHPLYTLPGVGVVYKLMEGFYAHQGANFQADRALELAALGIVADVAELRGDTRTLLQRGLQHLRKTKRLGLQALFANADLNPACLDEDHIGFQIAPRLNAVGRLGDANQMVEFLTTDDPARARVLGAQIEGLNAQRRFATRQVTLAAEELLQVSPEDRRSSAIVLYQPEWPQGVIGIVAGRLAEKYNKPAILLTGQDELHGSARSVEGINIHAAISAQSELLANHGGHPMAAGVSLTKANYTEFKSGVCLAVSEQAQGLDLTPAIVIDQTISLADIDLHLIAQVARLAPFGPGNPPLHFLVRDLTLVSTASVGQTGEHRQVIARDETGGQQRFIWWNGEDQPLPEAAFDLVCQLSQSDYRGTPQVSAEWTDFRLSAKGIQAVKDQQIEILDYRHSPVPEERRNQVIEANPDLQFWSEGSKPALAEARNRQQLLPNADLVIWTAPPSQSVLDDVMAGVKPAKVILFGVDPSCDEYTNLMETIAGMIKHSLAHPEEQLTVTTMASACAQTESAMRTSLRLWEAYGKIRLSWEEDQVVVVQSSQLPQPEAVQRLKRSLQAQLKETAAFRNFFRTARVQALFPNHQVRQSFERKQ